MPCEATFAELEYHLLFRRKQVVRDEGSVSESEQGRRFAEVPSAVSLTAAFPEIARAVPPEDRQDAEHTLIAPVLGARDEDLADVFATVPTTYLTS